MKIGIKTASVLFVTSCVFLVAIKKKALYNNSKQLQLKIKEDLGKDASQYLRLINYGINPDDAFKIVSGK